MRKDLSVVILIALLLLGCTHKGIYPEISAIPALTSPMVEFGSGQTLDELRQNKEPFQTNEFTVVEENPFLNASDNPLSTFSIDVDTASYTVVRKFIEKGSVPPKDAVRLEEMINYFAYDYPQPTNGHPFSVTTEVSTCPWADGHKLVLIGLQGLKPPEENLPPSNLVFLLDVSGSMENPEKLPLVKKAFRLLVDKLRPQDRVAIVVYAGASGLVLPSTSGSEKEKIIRAIDRLSAKGSTAGGAGIRLAYQTAKENFMADGNNRVILATDGDFNVGASSTGELEDLIEAKRGEGIYLTALGFGMGNYKDNKLETLADKGNGNYFYIDDMREAKKVFGSQLTGTLFTIAKDVKLQIEFNPATVKAYRLLGYENRLLRKEDLNNDKKDAGELGAGHSVTALYELIPPGLPVPEQSKVDRLKYQKPTKHLKGNAGELLTVKLRYKKPREDSSALLSAVVSNSSKSFISSSENLRFASAVAGFALLLKDSKYKGKLNVADVSMWMKGASERDPEGYRSDCLKLVGLYDHLNKETAVAR